MTKKKKRLIGIGMFFLIALVIGGMFLKGKLDEMQLQKDQEYFSQPANMVGRWVSEDGSLSFLIYTPDEWAIESYYRIRVDLGNLPVSGPSVMEGKVPTTRAYIHYLEVLDDTADTNNWQVQMEVWPLRKLDAGNNRFEGRVVYHPNRDSEESEELGTFVFRKDTSFVDETTGEISQATTEEVIMALNQACNDYYYDAEVGVMDVEFDDPGTTGIYGEGVNYDGYLHGTGILAPVDGNVFQTGTTQIEFYVDPAAEPISVYYLENNTLGQTIVSNYLIW